MFRFGDYALDPARRVLTRDGAAVTITSRAFDVLLALVSRAGQTVTKDELLATVWPDAVVEEANLTQQIFTLRKLLGHRDADPLIATVPRRGYQFVGRVSGTPRRPSVMEPRTVAGPLRVELALPPQLKLAIESTNVIAVSPDGTVVVAVVTDGELRRLVRRRLHAFEWVPIPGSDGAAAPFFSPDGKWIAFEAGRRLLKIALDDGAMWPVCDVADMRGGTWTHSDTIVFAPGPTTGLFQVEAHGGTPRPLTTLDFDGGERTHRWPHALPDGSGVIFTIGAAGVNSFDDASLAVVRFDGARHQPVLHHGSSGRCDIPGELLWSRGAMLFCSSFDHVAGVVTGAPRVVQHDVAASATGVSHFACSRNRTLVHIPGPAQTMRHALVSVGRDGAPITRHISGEALEEPRWLPDGSAVLSMRQRSSDLWVFDFARGVPSRLTFGGENFSPVPGPATDSITFSSSQGGPADLYVLRLGTATPPVLLVASEFDKVAGSWSPDRNLLIFTEYHPDSGADIWVLDRGQGTVRPFMHTRFNEYSPVFSPDGRFVAYVTDEAGRHEVVVVTFPDGTQKRQISIDGGTEPVWSKDGRDLYYRNGDRMMRVDLSKGIGQAGVPVSLFEGRFVAATVTLANYDVAPDGTTFLMVTAEAMPAPAALAITVGYDSGTAQ